LLAVFASLGKLADSLLVAATRPFLRCQDAHTTRR